MARSLKEEGVKICLGIRLQYKEKTSIHLTWPSALRETTGRFCRGVYFLNSSRLLWSIDERKEEKKKNVREYKTTEMKRKSLCWKDMGETKEWRGRRWRTTRTIAAEHMLSLNYSYFPFTRLLHLGTKHQIHLSLQPNIRTV